MADFDIDKALDQDYPESVRFEEPNQKLIGVFQRLDTGFTEYGETRILVLEVEGKEVGVWLFHTALLSQLKKAKPRVGQEVGIKYLGKQQGGQFSYHNYRVVVPPSEGQTFDWDALDEPEEMNQDLDASSGFQADDTTQDPTESAAQAWGSQSSSSVPAAPTPSGWGGRPDLATELDRLEKFGKERSGQEIYMAAAVVYERNGWQPPATREAMFAEKDPELLRQVNDHLEGGGF